jgi:hypothetical protein
MAVVAVVTLTGGFMLAGCQSQPGVAAYVGDTKITIDQVDTIVDEADTDLHAQHNAIDAAVYGDVRQNVLSNLIFVEVARRYVQEHGLSEPAVDADTTAQDVGLPSSDRYVILRAQATAYQDMLLARSAPRQPTDAELRGIFDRAPHGSQTFEQARPQLQAIKELPVRFGLRDELQKEVDAYHVVVNPRYRGIEIPVSQLQVGGKQFTALAVSLGSDDVAGSDFVSS